MSTWQELASDHFNISRLGTRAGRWPYVADLFAFVVFVTAYYFAFRYGMSFSPTTASPFWFPDSILLCALLMVPPRKWWIYLLVPIPLRLFSDVARDIPSWFLLATTIGDLVKGVLAALALRNFLDNPLRLQTLRDFAAFCLIAVLLVPAIGAFGGAAFRNALGFDYWSAWRQWFLGDALTQLVVTPAILHLVIADPRRLGTLSLGRRIEAGLTFGGLLLTGYFASHMGLSSTLLAEPRFYAPTIFMFWAAIRFGMSGASAAIGLLAFSFISAAVRETGPFSGHSPADTAIALQSFLFPRAFVLYLTALSIEEMRRAQNYLRESEERFRNLANSAPAMIWMSGHDKLCDFCNRSWLEFTGRTMESEAGMGRTESVHPQDLQRCLQVYYSAFDSHEPFEMEYRLRRRDGEYRWILDKGGPRYTPNGDFLGYIGCAIDITERKSAEELNKTLAHMQRIAVAGELSATMAHEVRQPLNAMLINTVTVEKLLDFKRPPLEEIREIVSDIREAVLRANEVIGRTRAFFRKRDIKMRPLDINTTISDVIGLVAAEARQRSMAIRVELAAGLPLVIGDRTHLQQVLLNLIANGMDAMRNTPESTRQLMLQSKLNDDQHVELRVIDHGSGIATERLPHIFETCFSTKNDSVGLGLAVARSIIDAHRGRIWAENNQEGGATFHFTVRTERCEEA